MQFLLTKLYIYNMFLNKHVANSLRESQGGGYNILYKKMFVLFANIYSDLFSFEF